MEVLMTSNPNKVPQSGTEFLYLMKDRFANTSDLRWCREQHDTPLEVLVVGVADITALPTCWSSSRPMAPSLVDRSGRHTNPDLQQQFIGDTLLAPRGVLIRDPANQCV